MSHSSFHQKRDWHPADIRAAIVKKGTNIAELARHHGYASATPFYNAMKISYPKIERIIADFLDTEPSEIWPSRYQKPEVDFKTSDSKSYGHAV